MWAQKVEARLAQGCLVPVFVAELGRVAGSAAFLAYPRFAVSWHGYPFMIFQKKPQAKLLLVCRYFLTHFAPLCALPAIFGGRQPQMGDYMVGMI